VANPTATVPSTIAILTANAAPLNECLTIIPLDEESDNGSLFAVSKEILLGLSSKYEHDTVLFI
jgi:hypothetical protein